MKIYIDADACPVVSIAEKVAAKFQIPGDSFVRHESYFAVRL